MDQAMTINVLFLCTGNSARSIVSECLLNDLGAPNFRAFSAGSRPSGTPHPDGIAMLTSKGHDVSAYASKSWDVFAGDDAPKMDIIVTVCGSAAGEVCPVWPRLGDNPPITVHWGADDPAYVEPLAARQKAFEHVYDLCEARINALIALPKSGLSDRAALQSIADITA